MSLSPIALEALRAAQSAFTKPEADVFEDALARGLEAVDREGRLVGAFAAAELARLESLVNAQPATLSEAQVEALAAAGNRAVNDATHDDLCACDAWPEKCLSSGGFFQGYWDMGGLETAIPAVVGLWESMRADAAAGELGRLRARVAELEEQRKADHKTWQHDLRAARAEREGSAARIAELEAERHSTNEALDDAVQELRGRRNTELAERSADRLTRMLAPTQALREDKPEAPLVVFRASHDSIVIERYTTAAEARKHCESLLRREEPDAELAWTEEEDDVQSLTFTVNGEFQDWSGYVVTRLEIASEFDPDGDE